MMAGAQSQKYDLQAFGQRITGPGVVLPKKDKTGATTGVASSSAAGGAAAAASSASAATGDNSDAATHVSHSSASEEGDGSVTLRVFAGKAFVSPGALYKSVVASPQMTARDVIKKTLERYGETDDAKEFDLVYRTFSEAKQGSLSKIFSSRSKVHTLDLDECPVLVAEWFNDAIRAGPTQRSHSQAKLKALLQ